MKILFTFMIAFMAFNSHSSELNFSEYDVVMDCKSDNAGYQLIKPKKMKKQGKYSDLIVLYSLETFNGTTNSRLFLSPAWTEYSEGYGISLYSASGEGQKLELASYEGHMFFGNGYFRYVQNHLETMDCTAPDNIKDLMK
ncbi:MAG: hypothetical protein PHY93_21130 [Bacteriovorax sp.]|nr:hypothetical protein [Bacteriovorax sp.]